MWPHQVPLFIFEVGGCRGLLLVACDVSFELFQIEWSPGINSGNSKRLQGRVFLGNLHFTHFYAAWAKIVPRRNWILATMDCSKEALNWSRGMLQVNIQLMTVISTCDMPRVGGQLTPCRPIYSPVLVSLACTWRDFFSWRKMHLQDWNHSGTLGWRNI